MSDNYQAVYDAVRSRIGGVDIGGAVERVLRECFDVHTQVVYIAQEFSTAALEQQRPSVLFKPSIGKDGNLWSALYGSNLAEGVSGFGDSPEMAMRDFDVQWHKKLSERKP